MATGWTGGLIAPDQRIHDAANAAIDSTGGSTSAVLRNAVLRDPTLGSRSVGGAASAPLGATVGNASVAQNNGIPSTIANAMVNLNTNTQNQTLAQILNQVLHGLNGGSGNTSSPAQDAWAQRQTDMSFKPEQIQQQINTLQAQQPALPGSGPMAPMGGTYAGSAQQNRDNQLNVLYGAQGNPSGWTAPGIQQQQANAWNAQRTSYFGN